MFLLLWILKCHSANLASKSTELTQLLEEEEEEGGLQLGIFEYSLGTALQEYRHDHTITSLETIYSKIDFHLHEGQLRVKGLPSCGLLILLPQDPPVINQGRQDDHEVRLRVNGGNTLWLLLMESTAEAMNLKAAYAKQAISIEEIMDRYACQWVISTAISGQAKFQPPAEDNQCRVRACKVAALAIVTLLLAVVTLLIYDKLKHVI